MGLELLRADPLRRILSVHTYPVDFSVCTPSTCDRSLDICDTRTRSTFNPICLLCTPTNCRHQFFLLFFSRYIASKPSHSGIIPAENGVYLTDQVPGTALQSSQVPDQKGQRKVGPISSQPFSFSTAKGVDCSCESRSSRFFFFSTSELRYSFPGSVSRPSEGGLNGLCCLPSLFASFVLFALFVFFVLSLPRLALWCFQGPLFLQHLNVYSEYVLPYFVLALMQHRTTSTGTIWPPGGVHLKQVFR